MREGTSCSVIPAPLCDDLIFKKEVVTEILPKVTLGKEQERHCTARTYMLFDSDIFTFLSLSSLSRQ